MILKPNANVLISGCGGGFDFFCGSPIGLELEKQGHKVVYSSLTFSNLGCVVRPIRVSDGVVLVDENSRSSDGYFPEKVFCDWYKRAYGRSTRVYCYAGVSVRLLTFIFDLICEREGIDYHFVVDGGCDGIFRGDEYNLGSPSTDAISIIAASRAKKVMRRDYVLTAFGTEGVGKEVSHAQALNRVSDLIAKGTQVSVSSIANNSEVATAFLSAFDYLTRTMPREHQSTITSSIAASLRGMFGDCAVDPKTESNPVWISPLTSLMWFMDVEAVAKSKLYYDEVVRADTSTEVYEIIGGYIKRNGTRKRDAIPI